MPIPFSSPGSPSTPADSIIHLDGPLLKRLVYASLVWLSTNQQMVNALNVFPVPDGDTGTNMLLTMQAAYQEITDHDTPNAGMVARGAAHGALMGARGNSGVILSQILRGIARSLDARETVDTAGFAHALTEARETAYKGVVRPVEGTILTVASDIAAAAQAASAEGCSFAELLDRIVAAAGNSVQRTPDLLPVLREAGVVDAGGKGLFILMEGMQRFLRGLPLDQPVETAAAPLTIDWKAAEGMIEAGQDYEVVVDFSPAAPFDLDHFYRRLEDMGTSIQIGQGDDLYRMHIHVPTDKRYEPIEYILEIGTVSKVTMENLQTQTDAHREKGGPDSLRLPPVEPGQIAAVAVVPGLGLSKVFASLGVAAIVPGGQSMNPSTQEILSAFADLPTDRIIILPNNKNIQMAAQQTAALSHKQITVVPTRSIPQGIAAMLAYQHQGGLESVAAAMAQSMEGVESGEITLATRSVDMNGVQVAEGQYIGLHNGDLKSAGRTLEETLRDLLGKMGAESRELITLYWGEDLTPGAANALADKVREWFPKQEVEIHEGNQPHYFLILSVE